MKDIEFIKTGELRNSVKWFAEQMELKLKKNDHKGGWHNCTLQFLSMRLTQERKELAAALESKDPHKIISECADVANFAMMIAEQFKKSINECEKAISNIWIEPDH